MVTPHIGTQTRLDDGSMQVYTCIYVRTHAYTSLHISVTLSIYLSTSLFIYLSV